MRPEAYVLCLGICFPILPLHPVLSNEILLQIIARKRTRLLWSGILSSVLTWIVWNRHVSVLLLWATCNRLVWLLPHMSAEALDLLENHLSHFRDIFNDLKSEIECARAVGLIARVMPDM